MVSPRPPPNDAPPTYTPPFETVELDDFRKVEVSRAHTAPDTTPYLGLQARLSQVWLNRCTVLLLLVLIRVVISLSTLDTNIGEARTRALTACSKVEDIGSSVASMPHYLSRGVNELAAEGVESAARGMAATLLLSVTAVENMVLFILGMMTDTYAGVTAAVVRGSLDGADAAVSQFAEASNKALEKIASSLESSAKSLQEDIDKMVEEIQRDVFGTELPDIPEADFADTLDELRNFDVDTDGFTSELEGLEEDLPDYNSVRDAAERAISAPFEKIRKGINDSFADFEFDRDAFSLAKKQSLTFCSDNEDLNSFFDDLYSSVQTGRTILLVALLVLALAAMASAAWLEIKRFRLQRTHAHIAEGAQYDPLDVAYLSARPLSAKWGMKLASRFSGKKQVLVRWCVAYATSLPALFVLSLGLAGLLSCICQFTVLSVVRTRVPELAERVADFAGEVVGMLQGASKEWAGSANGVIGEMSEKMNEDLAGLVRDGAAAVNETLSTFATEMQKGVEDVLGGPLDGATDDIVKALSGLDTGAVQKGLSWLEDQARISFPKLSDDAFSLGAEESIDSDSDLTAFLASPSSITTDEVTGAVSWVVDKLERGILIELFVSLGLLLMYVIVVLAGVVRMLVGARTPDRDRGGPAALPRYGGARAQEGGGAFADVYGGFDEYYSSDLAGIQDEKRQVSVVRAGTAEAVSAHVRQSSYGDIRSAGKF
ncbi:hypothetical protein VUR80DRAFT_7177 [Thermomyces stellatus]